MKIKLNTSLLTTAVKSTGANIRPRSIVPGNEGEIVQFSDKSLTRNGSLKIDERSALHINSLGGLIYVFDLWVILTDPLSKLIENKKFHVTDCEECRNLMHEGNYELFPILKYYPTRNKLKLAEKKFGLKPCEACLDAIDWDGYKTAQFWAKQPIYNQFNVDQFIETMESFELERTFNLLNSDMLASLPQFFPRILQIAKKKSRWTCDECNREFSGYKNLFHLIDGGKKRGQSALDYGEARAICLPCLRIEYPKITLIAEEEEFLKNHQ